MGQPTAVDHELVGADAPVHFDWDRSRDPALTVQPGDTIRFRCRDSFNGAITPDTEPDDIRDETSPGHALTGPVEVNGAMPGDVLAVELQGITHEGWGYTFFRPSCFGEGLLPELFDDPGLHFWDLDDDVGRFVDNIEVPLDPFPGVIGVAPDDNESLSTVPPRNTGGNLDIKHLIEGATVFLPVAVEGALLSIGDGHAAQGDGEVCLTAIEAPLSVTVRVTLHPEMDIEQPQFETPTESVAVETGTLYGTTGIADDLMTATKNAIEQMIDHLCSRRGLTRGQAYMLCSVAVDLKLNEVVNEPNYVVSAYLPTMIFPD